MEDKNLQHVGVLGMRWGHRKGNNTVTSVRGQTVSKQSSVRGVFTPDPHRVRIANIEKDIRAKKRLLMTLIGTNK